MLRRRAGIGKVFARHAYGMRRWAELFAARLDRIEDAELAETVSAIVADNSRHMVLFRERAAAHGVDPDAYRPPPEGEATYRPIPELDLEGAIAYALGSVEHFDELLGTYLEAAEGPDRVVLEDVRADNRRTIERLRPLLAAAGEPSRAEAHERYRVRELVEAPRYAHGV